MNSRDVIRHPGPENKLRVISAMGDVAEHSVGVKAGDRLMQAVAVLMDNAECDSGVIVLDGVKVGPFDYVMPGYSKDDSHAAWYSDTYSCAAATLRHATAIVGRRDGVWWLHCHAIWDAQNAVGIGHLLPDDVTIAADATVTLHAVSGARFEVALDAETAFPVFHVHGERHEGNALIAKIYPHEDIHTSIEVLIGKAGFTRATVYGIGSLIGARFEEGNAMVSPISEVLVPPGATWDGALKLPMICVDTQNNQYEGTIVKDGAPVTVTFELMIVDAGSDNVLPDRQLMARR